MKTIFLRVIDENDKAAALLKAIREPEKARGGQRFEVDAASFSAIPQCPFVYRVPAPMLALAANGETLIASGAKARQGFGAATRFHRLAWEVSPAEIGAGRRWLWLAHGTKPAPFFKPTFHVVLWADQGREAKADVLTRYPYLNGNYGFKIQAEEYYGRPGLCYGKRTGRFTVQVMPPEHAFSFEGTAIHAEASVDVWHLLALLNSEPIAFWLNNASAQHKTYSYVDSTPFPVKIDGRLALLAQRGWKCQFELRRSIENGNYFALPSLLQSEGENLAQRANAWAQFVRDTEFEIAEILGEINDRCFDLYEIDEADRLPIRLGFGGGIPEQSSSSTTEADVDDDLEDDDVEISANPEGLAADLCSWLVGVAFGRFDVRLATGARGLPTLPEPFAQMPVCSPAMLFGDDGLPLATPPAGYPLGFPENGILVDDRGHPRDLAAAIRLAFDEVFAARADARWSEFELLLDSKGHEIRTWLASNFFEYHLKRYSKGRRKAPIYWQLAIPSGRYSIWLYAHRLTHDSFFRIQNDVVVPRLAHEERQLTSLIQSVGPSPSAKERKDVAEQEALIGELRSFLEEVKLVSPLWHPTLDDGVSLTMAPLWRLLPQHKPWQKELKSKWDDLTAGKYDWAHVAMHLWPERVIPKCAADRSLAISHGLEDVFWAEGRDGKWRPRPIPTRPMDELVRERTSVAVKLALRGLTEASAPNGSKARGRRSSS
ncbi:MAG: hypothetical protein KDK08_23885 [Rhizobiaceae bacterium]|nr:hypothetical protein [Rhizobiaceae bacterium]